MIGNIHLYVNDPVVAAAAAVEAAVEAVAEAAKVCTHTEMPGVRENADQPGQLLSLLLLSSSSM